ncbi:MAG TPA: LPS assembly lipoprotein LptE [Gemmatimonadaceae bacterium]|nr:LPS assembly lipoprotein LptE [Gemmatimonadaceae bacterium]
MIRTILAVAAGVGLLATVACRYSLNGGGLPTDIKSVAIIPFDNETPSPELQQELNAALRAAVASKLGLKEASEDKASAVVRGKIVKYDLDVATAFSANPAQATSSRRQLQLTVHVEIFDQIHNRALMTKDLTAIGNYPEGGEATGRKQAIDKIVSDVIQGAQSNW